MEVGSVASVLISDVGVEYWHGELVHRLSVSRQLVNALDSRSSEVSVLISGRLRRLG